MDWELLADQPLGQKLIKKGFWLYFFMFLIAPVGYFIKVIISNNFSVEDVGLFYSILSFLFIIALYNDLWLTEALQYFLPKYRINKEYNKYKTISVITRIAQLISWIVIVGILYFWAPRLAEHYFKNPDAVNILQVMAFMYFGRNFIQVFSSFFTAFQNVIATNIIEACRMYSVLFLTLYLWLSWILNMHDFSLWRVIWTYIAIGLGLIIFIKKYGHTLKKWIFQRDPITIKKQMKYARWAFLWANVSTLLLNINQQMSIFFLWSANAGYFTNFLSIFTIFTFFFSPIIAFLFPLVNELLEKKETKKFDMLLKIFYKYFSVFALIFSWIFMALGPEISIILFGTKFIHSGILTTYAAPFLIINLLYTINFYILGWMGKVKERVKYLFRWLSTNIIISLISMYFFQWWEIGIIIGMIAGWWTLFFLTWRHINKHQKITFDRKFFIKNLTIIWSLSIIIYCIKGNIFIVNNGYRFQNIGYFLLIGIVYIGMIWWANYKNIGYLLKEIRQLKK